MNHRLAARRQARAITDSGYVTGFAMAAHEITGPPGIATQPGVRALRLGAGRILDPWPGGCDAAQAKGQLGV
jgi:hypothetical protein